MTQAELVALLDARNPSTGPRSIHTTRRSATGHPGALHSHAMGFETTASDRRGGLLRRDRLRMGGLDDNVIARMRAAGIWTTVRPGAYIATEVARGAAPSDAHRTLIAATLPVIDDDAVISHESAAVLHGLALWDRPLTRVAITRPGHGGGHKRRWLHTHVSPLRPDEVVTVNGVRVTSAARTVIDLARSSSFESGVVTADHALHEMAVSVEELQAARTRALRWPGATRAARVVAFADGLAESPGESRSRVQMMRLGLPKPRLQVPMWSADGAFIGRVDFYFDEFRTVGEFDGKIKYGRLLPEQRDGDSVAKEVGRALFKEKLREDALRAIPVSMARWVWADIDRKLMSARLNAGFRVGRALMEAPVQGRIG